MTALNAAWIAANKHTLMAAGAVGVGGLALYKRKSKGKAGGVGTGVLQPDGTMTTLGGVPVASPQNYAGAAYDSTASDLYGAIQPQIEAIGSQLGDLQNLINAQPSPTPVPAPPAPAPAPGPRPPAPAAPTPAGPSPAGTMYTVRPGDSLSAIAARYPSPAITWRTIYAANKSVIGGNPNLIRPGQTLRIA